MSIDQGKYMPTNILFSNSPENWTRWQPHLERCLSARGVDAVLATNFDDPADVDFVVYAPTGGVDDFTPFTNLRAILSTWAGVEKIVTNESIKVPLARMVGRNSAISAPVNCRSAAKLDPMVINMSKKTYLAILYILPPIDSRL